MQRFGVLYQGISHECLVFSEYTHDEPSGHAIENTVAKKKLTNPTNHDRAR